MTENIDASDEATPAFDTGEEAHNVLSGRKVTIIAAEHTPLLGFVYTLYEEGFDYPPGCSHLPNAGVLPEAWLVKSPDPVVLTPTDLHDLIEQRIY